jgi:hypothetical protein
MSRFDLMISRRNLLARLGTAVALPALSGCVKHIQPPTPFQCVNTAAPPAPLDLVIDAHCHIFNGTDLQVAPFLRQIANIEWEGTTPKKRLPEAVMKVVADLLQASVWTNAPDAGRELELIGSLMGCSNDPAVRLEVASKQLANQQRQAHVNAQKSILGSRMMKQFAAKKSRTTPMSDASGATEENTLAEIQQRLGPSSADDYHQMRARRKQATAAKKLKAETASQAQAEEALDGVIEYVYQGFQYRLVSVLAYQQTFHERPSADLMVAAMVDYDWWLAGGKPTRTSLKDQVKVMSCLSILTGGQVHGLVPFDPLREVAWRAGKGKHAWSSLSFVQDAVLNQGCIGVKMYPPMGFAPYGNSTLGRGFWEGHALPEWMHHPVSYHDGKPALDLGQRLDDVLAEFYRWCVDKDVPVMAHTSMSNGTCPEFMSLAGSKYWGWALDQFRGLRVSFGHTGDFSGPGVLGYPKESMSFAALMGKAPARGFNAYADAGYFSEVLKDTGGSDGQPDGWQKLEQQFKDFYLNPQTTDAAPFYERMMYGTDWSLLLNEGNIATYLEKFRRLFEMLQKADNAPAGLERRFFGANAAAWLGLKDGATRERLNKFYSNNGLDTAKYPPAWLKKV